MAVDVVIGAQRGDEGKGNFCSYLGLNGDYSIALRAASPQAGHSIYIEGKRKGLVHLPCAVVNSNLRILLTASSFISPKKIFYGGKDIRPYTGEEVIIEPEIPMFNLTPERLGIDYRAKLVTEEHVQREREDERFRKRGSVLSGVNAAKMDLLCKDDEHLKFVTSDNKLKKFAIDTSKELYSAIVENKHILFETDHGIELCQNFGVFPYNTARTINTSAYLGEAGLPPQSIRNVYLVIKPYVSLVSSTATIEKEITNKKVLEELVSHGGETGSVSGRPRRAGRFSFENFCKAIFLSGATKIAISHLDLSEDAWKEIGFQDNEDFLKRIKSICSQTYPNPEISLLSYGPKTDDIIEYEE
jgi:adenylosuccinate synthase